MEEPDSSLPGWSRKAYEILLANGHSREYYEAIKRISDLSWAIKGLARAIHSAYADLKPLTRIAEKQKNPKMLRILADLPGFDYKPLNISR